MSEARIVSPSPETDDQRRGHLHADQLAGMVGRRARRASTRRRSRADHRADGVGEVEPVGQRVLDQVRDDLGVGLGRERVALLLEPRRGAPGGSRRSRCGSRRRARCSPCAGGRSRRSARRASPSACAPSRSCPPAQRLGRERRLELGQLAGALADRRARRRRAPRRPRSRTRGTRAAADPPGRSGAPRRDPRSRRCRTCVSSVPEPPRPRPLSRARRATTSAIDVGVRARLVLGLGLDHHADERLGPAGAHQHAAASARARPRRR